MDYSKFVIKNFKGIDHLELDLDRSPNGSIFTLVGLNESGKTTVLEAVKFFDERSDLETLFDSSYTTDDIHDLIPMKKKGNFNDDIEVSATIHVDDTDKEVIKGFCKKKIAFEVETEDIPDIFTVSRVATFKNSELTEDDYYYGINIIGKKKRAKKKKNITELSEDDYNTFVTYIEDLLPAILYFPSFLFEIPSKILLNDYREKDKSAINSYYKLIIQDILDALDENYDLDDHVIDRAIRHKKYNVYYHKRNLDSVITKMSNLVTKTIYERWNEVFDKKIPRKDIKIETSIEEIEGPEETEYQVFLSFMIKDGDSIYLVSERSLGFRWFFCFLLFTQFRQYRKTSKNTLFLLDEPASNLHSKAQTQLMKSFPKITEQGGKIIYSTHSQYMINPHWLENAYIVINEGLKYEEEEEFDYSSRDTLIDIDPYRNFVGQYPDKVTYFQPILDTLDYVPSNLELIPSAVFVEGKNDYYLFRYFDQVHFGNDELVKFIPGNSASGLDDIIALYMGWGRNFIVLLDDDKEGRASKNRYIKEWLLSNDVAFTLNDVSSEWKGFEAEDLISDNDKELLMKQYYGDNQPKRITKKDIARSIQENLMVENKINFDSATESKFQELIAFCNDKLRESN